MNKNNVHNEKKKESKYDNPFQFSQEVLDGKKKVVARLPKEKEESKNG